MTIAEELNKIKASNNNVFIPENNYSNLSQQFKNKDKNIEEQKKWVSKILTNQEILTEKCEEYVNDVKNYNLGYDGSIEEEELKIKWGNKYDLNYKNHFPCYGAGFSMWVQSFFKLQTEVISFSNNDMYSSAKLLINLDLFY